MQRLMLSASNMCTPSHNSDYSEPTTVLGRPQQLLRAVGNLLDNAVKYLDPSRPGLVRVTAETRGSRVAVHVADNGRGIAPQDHARVFELFRRAGAQDRPGEGIGLAHVKAMARALGGRVTLRSAPGEGSTFTVILPQEPAIEARREAAE